MKNSLPVALALMLLLTACAPQARPTEDPVPEPDAVESIASVLVDLLSGNLGLDADEINLIEQREAEFSDVCLEAAPPETVCAQASTPGRIFILEANNIEYEYRTTLSGDSIRPATLALTWRREGGIAGFCDGLTVYLSGEVYSTNCRSRPMETSGTFAELLSSAGQEQFISWYLKFGQTDLDASDPQGVSDRMIITLMFHGTGTSQPAQADQQAMFDWAQELLQKLNS